MISEKIILRGEAAKHIFDHPSFKTLLEQVKLDVFDQWATTPQSDKEKLEELHKTMIGLNKFYQKIVAYVGEAKIEAHNERAQ